MTLKIDFDDWKRQPCLKLQMLVYSLPMPFFIRKSSSGKGLHIHVPRCETWDFRRYVFDDPMRIQLDQERLKRQLPVSNLLWDIKLGKKAGSWTVIWSQSDLSKFLEDNLYAQSIYTMHT